MSLSNNFPAVRPTLLLDFAAARRLDPRITFVRASPATYYDGVTKALAEQNLSLYSQDYTQTQWLKAATSITATNILAPDGTNTASELTANGVLAVHELTTNQAVFTNGLIYTQTFFLKANTNNFAQLRFSGGLGGAFVNFNLSTGAVGTSGNGGVGSITSVVNSWYRCSITATVTATGSGLPCGVYIVSSQSAPSAETNSLSTSLYVWGAQMEQRSTATAYTPTTTSVVSNYIPVLVTAPAGTARFDFNPVTDQSLGLLIEEARTNLLLYSADFSDAAWTKAASSITSNTIVAPDGTISGDKLVENATTNFHYVVPALAITVSAGVSITVSVFAKQGERTGVGVFPYSSAAGARFNLADGTVFGTDAGVTATITAVGNGWYRCSATIVAPATSATPWILTLLSGSTNYTGDGYSGIYIWGAQLEVGLFSTTYIATVATTQQRNADDASMTGSNFTSWFSPAEMTIYSEASSASGAAYTGYVYSIGVDFNNSIQHYRQSDFQPVARVRVDSVDTYGAIGNGAIWTGTSVNKFALALSATSGRQASNGSLATGGDDTDIRFPTMTSITIGALVGGTSLPINGTIRKIAYYDVRLTNAQLQALTQS